MSNETSKEEVRQRVKSWLTAFNSKNKEDLYALFHPEMIYANDGAPLMQGTSQVQPWYEQAFQMMSGRALFREEAITIMGNTALAVGKFYFEPEEKNAQPGETGRVAMIWRREPDGPWLLCFDMDNRPPDSLPENFAGATEDAYLMPQGAQA